MGCESCQSTIVVLVVFVAIGQALGSVEHRDEALQNTLIKRMDNIQNQLAEVVDSMGSLDSDIARSLQNCLGIHSDLCEALEIETGLKSQRELGSYWGPGKRAVSPQLDSYRRLYAELRRKRAVVKHLMGVVRGANGLLMKERKRSCEVNLGFHCQTEHISDFADMYDYLASPNSPGKKRSVRSLP